MEKPDILSMNPAELEELVISLGEKKFRAAQLWSWMQKGASLDEMTNLPKAFCEKLASQTEYRLPAIERKYESKLDGTVKYVFRLFDGELVESVFMKYEHGTSVCVSSQAGCAMGCRFCASTIGGLVRRLEPYEMLDEVLFTQVDSGLPVSHIVLMGIGEPLDNFDNVMRFLELVNSPEGMNISMRHISLSTCGLVPKIDELAKRKLQLTLSVSLHAPNDEVRDRIMPVNKAYPSEELLAACRRYYQATSRRISFEYAMIDGVNDRPEDAKELLRRLKGLPAHFNLIPLNRVEESPLKPSTRAAVAAFQKTLEEGGVTATVRRTLGGDIDASCGQLRRKYNQSKENP